MNTLRKVWYIHRDGTRELAHVVQKHTDDVKPYYTVRIGNKEVQTVRERLRRYESKLYKRLPYK